MLHFRRYWYRYLCFGIACVALLNILLQNFNRPTMNKALDEGKQRDSLERITLADNNENSAGISERKTTVDKEWQQIPRHKNNGDRDWQGVYKQGNQLFAYSAFFDNRTIPQSQRPEAPHVVIIGLTVELPKKLFCGFSESEKSDVTDFTPASFRTSFQSARKPPFTKFFVVHCPWLRTKRLPSYVVLDHNITRLVTVPEWKIRVEFPQVPRKRLDFLVCVNDVYNIGKQSVDPLQPKRVIEWLELNRILGVDHFVVYKHSMSPQIEAVMEYYAEKGLLDVYSKSVLAFDPPFKKPDSDVSLNDCLYRFMHSYNYIIFVDFDEVITSYKSDNYSALLEEVSKFSRAGKNDTHFMFRNQRYFIDDPSLNPALAHPHPLVTQYATRHVVPEKEYVRTKHIMAPHVCFAVSPHYCVGQIPGIRYLTVALSRHYKSCVRSRGETRVENCTAMFQSSVQDTSMTRFGNHLLQNYKTALKEFESFVVLH